MSWVRLFKRVVAAAPTAGWARFLFASVGQGYNTPAAYEIIDENGVRTVLGLPGNGQLSAHQGHTRHRIRRWDVDAGERLQDGRRRVRGGGGQAGGAATSSATASVGGGGGGGAYAASTLTGAAIKSTSYSVGAKGSTAALARLDKRRGHDVGHHGHRCERRFRRRSARGRIDGDRAGGCCSGTAAGSTAI